MQVYAILIVKILPEDRAFIETNLENGRELLEKQDMSEIMIALDLLELKKGYDGSFEDGINDFGRQIERINDRLYYGNQTQE